MLFLTNELAKKAEITILSAREATRPGRQAGASWVERKAVYKGKCSTWWSSRPLNQPCSELRLICLRALVISPAFDVVRVRHVNHQGHSTTSRWWILSRPCYKTPWIKLNEPTRTPRTSKWRRLRSWNTVSPINSKGKPTKINISLIWN